MIFAPLSFQRTLDSYRSTFGGESVPQSELNAIESTLGVKLPDDFRVAAEVFAGGKLGGIEHYRIASTGKDSIVERTLAARQKYKLNPKYIVLAEPPRRFIFLSLDSAAMRPPGVVYSVPDFEKPFIAAQMSIQNLQSVHQMESYLGYAEFFSDLVGISLAEGTRKTILERVPKLSPAKLQQFRHRWNELELRSIGEMLRSGRIERPRFAETDFEGRKYTDLRGITLAEIPIGTKDQGQRVVLENLDLSYCRVVDPRGQLVNVSLSCCRLVEADLLQSVSNSFLNCDFTRAKGLYNGFMKGDFIDCKFIGADLRKTLMGDRFIRCDFSAADLRGAEFCGTAEDCKWDGCLVGLGMRIPGRK